MWKFTTLLFALTSFVAPGNAPVERAAPGDIVGRWDFVVTQGAAKLPSWLEVRPSGNGYVVGQFVGVVGMARPVARIDTTGGMVRFSIPPQWEQGKGDLQVEGRMVGGELHGTMTFPDGNRSAFAARRAPSLRRTATPAWGDTIQLFNGKDLTGWRALGTNQWRAVNGVLQSPKSGSNLVTERTFTDYTLHLEFRYPKGSNSGVYQRGRYEVQIEDSLTTESQNDLLGAVYGFLAPSEVVAKKPGEWQTFDITMVGRMITVVANGKTVICNREIPGPTGGALDADEGAPGPLLLQGDHGPIEYRNIVLRPAR